MIYLLSYEVTHAKHEENKLLALVRSHRHVRDWYSPYPGLFLLQSDVGLAELIEAFRQFFGTEMNHIIVPVYGSTAGGSLPNIVWDWINKNEPQLNALLSRR